MQRLLKRLRLLLLMLRLLLPRCSLGNLCLQFRCSFIKLPLMVSFVVIVVKLLVKTVIVIVPVIVVIVVVAAAQQTVLTQIQSRITRDTWKSIGKPT